MSRESHFSVDRANATLNAVADHPRVHIRPDVIACRGSLKA